MIGSGFLCVLSSGGNAVFYWLSLVRQLMAGSDQADSVWAGIENSIFIRFRVSIPGVSDSLV